MSEESCGNCRYFMKTQWSEWESPNNQVEICVCRRYPPILIDREQFSPSQFPTTKAHRWCGEWQKAIELEK